MPPFLPRAARLPLALLAARCATATRRLLHAFPAADDIRDAAAKLAVVVQVGQPDRHMTEIQTALSGANAAVDACATAGAEARAACRGEVRALIGSCARVVAEARDAALRRHVLSTLARVSLLHGVALEDLRFVVEVCERVMTQGDVPYWDLLGALDAVSQNEIPDLRTLEAITSVAVRLMQRADLPSEGSERPRFLFEAMSIVSRFAQHLGGDVPGCLRVVRAVRFIMDSTQEYREYFLVRLLAMNILLHRVVPVTRSDEVMGEVLGVLESCANVPWDQAMLAQAAQLVPFLAAAVGEAQLGRVVGVCEKMAGMPVVDRALEDIAKRLVGENYRGSDEVRLQLLARVFAIQASSRAGPRCGVALQLLGRLVPPLPPPLFAALRRRAGAAPSPELAMYVDEFVPLIPETLARSEIVGVCADAARRHPNSTGLRDLVRASCVQPQRVGLRAAQAAAAILGEGGGGEGLPDDLAAVGACLADEFRADDLSEGGTYLRSLDAAGAEEIAGVLLSAVAPVASAWPQARRRHALWGLCALTGGVHGSCRQVAAAA